MWLLLIQILFAIAQDESSDPSEVISFSPSVPVEEIPISEPRSIQADTDLPVDAVVLIVQGRTTCAGTLINENGWIATAYHCVAGGGKPGVETRDGRRTVGKVIKTSALYDLAIVEAQGLAGEPHVALSDALPERMSPVAVVGHPFGVRKGMGYMGGTLRWSAVTGVVSNVGDQALQISAPLNPGTCHCGCSQW